MLFNVLAVASLFALAQGADTHQMEEYTVANCAGDFTTTIPRGVTDIGFQDDTLSYALEGAWTGFSLITSDDKCTGESVPLESGCYNKNDTMVGAGSRVACIRSS
ncbi:hypothetical protein VMCG_06114 [Cytospora schulzeri]|uniref:Uncharacterized protein n=1 Tax=Cytospora schulzeri TaxID=448051 RepID=A0A423WGP2_9PEZI|nr:hypothetical protein VMCG_06114 [Valsa malicola]